MALTPAFPSTPNVLVKLTIWPTLYLHDILRDIHNRDFIKQADSPIVQIKWISCLLNAMHPAHVHL